jgi:hypothetical protein
MNAPLELTDDRAKYDAGRAKGEKIAYGAALFLPHRVHAVCQELRALASSLEQVNVLNTVAAYACVRTVRRKFSERRAVYKELLDDCTSRLAEPVDGASTIDSGWIQAWAVASGVAGLQELTQALSALTEAMDRKAAYTLACFSLYIATVSLTATLVLGLLSLK